jgi:hypothetical protein
VRRRAAALALALVPLLAPVPAAAQVALSNLLEAQAGQPPFADYFGRPTNRTSVYDQLNLDAEVGGIRAGLRFESHDNSERRETYQTVTQRWAEVSRDGLRVRAGNFYSILGRGLVQRAFELPGVVLDDPGSARRSAFSRDLDGVLVEGAAGPFLARLLSGTPGQGTDTPGEGTVAGAEASLGPWRSARAGATYLRATNGVGTRTTELGSGFLEADPLALAGLDQVALPVYVEYAQADRSFGEWWRLRLGDSVPHALYVSTNLLAGPFGLSAEWKDYRDFRLGINDPPSLVREHAFALPNRSTHVLNATSEHGFQIEGSWSLPGWGSATLNHSRSDGTPSGRALRFEETYGELHLAAARWPWLDATAFADRGHDTFGNIARREIWGAAATVRAFGPWSGSLDLERLDAERANLFGPSEGFTDWYASATVGRAGWGSASLVWQRTTDPLEEDPARFDDRIDPRSFLAGVVSATLGQSHTLTLTVGERRGGPACTAGTCYEVQPFEGAELRLTSRY